MKKRALSYWKPAVDRLRAAIADGQYVSVRTAAEEHGAKPGSLYRHLCTNAPEIIPELKRLKLQAKQQKIAAIKAQRDKVQRERQIQQQMRLAQTIFDMEDGMGIVAAAKKNNFDPSYLSLLLKRKGLNAKYRQIDIYGDDIKQKAIQLKATGLTVRAVAEKLGVSKSSVHLWCKQASTHA